MNLIKHIAKLSVLTILLAVILTATSTVFAQKGKNINTKLNRNTLWQAVDKDALPPRAAVSSEGFAEQTGKYRVFQVNRFALDDVLAQAPLEFTGQAAQRNTILEIPTPDGSFVHFRLEESPVLTSEVAAQFPAWKTFSGQGVEDPAMTARFDTNANGFHGYVMTAGGTFLIDPYSLTDRENYVVYYKGDLMPNNRSFTCNFKESKTGISNLFVLDSAASPADFSNGTTLRNFKLAVSATREYTNFFGSQAAAFAAVQTTVNRMITIYRRELATTFTLVSDTRTIFTNADTGGFTNNSSTDLDVNQAKLDMVYGNANYDIGHVFSVTANPDGLAASPSLCDPMAKAQGFTGSPTPQGDGYDVDYVAHEIGHQFSMSHTFNNDADGSCSTRSADSSYEPASGVTIMGYAGICAPRNLSANSIEYFNLRSFDQALSYLQTTVPANYPACGTNTNTGNTAPTINAGATTFNIPKQTPFTLTASATDANNDSLTYLWEEFDLGAATRNGGPVDTDEDGLARPIFRAYNPTTNGSRTFPSLYYILNNDNTPPLTYTGTLPFAPTSGSTAGYVCANGQNCVTGERLPSIARTMNFRVTVRDNNANGGGVSDALRTVVVSGAAGPFKVTTQDSLVPTAGWAVNSTQTVTWSVAGTNAAPVNAANVNILLSTDGGQTFPITLKANTPNDGTEQITVPNNPTTQARVKVEAVGNIFFDINNANFAIMPPTAASVSVSGRVLSQQGRGVPNALVSLVGQNGALRRTRTNPFGYYNFDDIGAGQTCVISVSAKSYEFAPQVVVVVGNIEGLNFTAR